MKTETQNKIDIACKTFKKIQKSKIDKFNKLDDWQKKEIIVSNTNKDAGMLYKSDKEKNFGYNTSVICENNNSILTVDTNPSNMHDSVAFYKSYENLFKKYEYI